MIFEFFEKKTLEKKINEQYENAIEKFTNRLRTNILYDLMDENKEIHYQISRDCVWYNGKEYYSCNYLSQAGGDIKKVFRLLQVHGIDILRKDCFLKWGLEDELKSVKETVKEFIKNLW